MLNNKYLLTGLIIVLLILAGFVYFWKQSVIKTQTSKTPPLATIEKTNVDYSKAPERFPANIPIEAGSQLTQNYNATTPQGIFQATRTFVTKQTLAANLKLYTDFLTGDGWTIKATTDNPTYKMVMGTKGKQSILVSIDENKVTKIKTVNINFSEGK